MRFTENPNQHVPHLNAQRRTYRRAKYLVESDIEQTPACCPDASNQAPAAVLRQKRCGNAANPMSNSWLLTKSISQVKAADMKP